MTGALIEARGLVKSFAVGGGLARRPRRLQAVAGLSFDVQEGETFGLVGESGSGKTTLARLIMGAEAPDEGSLHIAGQDCARRSKAQDFAFRRLLQPVLQDPYGSLNPRMRIGAIIEEPMRIHRMFSGRAAYQWRVAELLAMVALPADAARKYPHELSGGQRQRVAIARALSVDPRIAILDEPVSALDVSIQAQVLNLLKDLQRKLKLTYVLISHDLAVVGYMSAKIGVIYLGQFMEIGDRASILADARHPYTLALLAAGSARRGAAIDDLAAGEMPSPLDPPSGCPFHPRCPLATERCANEKPLLRGISAIHQVACHYAETTRKGTARV